MNQVIMRTYSCQNKEHELFYLHVVQRVADIRPCAFVVPVASQIR